MTREELRQTHPTGNLTERADWTWHICGTPHQWRLRILDERQRGRDRSIIGYHITMRFLSNYATNFMTSNIQSPTREWIIVSAFYSLPWRKNCWGKRKSSMHTKQEPLLIIPRGCRQRDPHNVLDKPTICPPARQGWNAAKRPSGPSPASVSSLLTGAPCSSRHFWIPAGETRGVSRVGAGDVRTGRMAPELV